MNRGFTLLEILAATFIVVLVLGGVYSLVAFNLRISGDAARHLEAAYLAQEGMEVARNMRDTNFLAIRHALCNPIVNPDAWKGSGACSAIIDLTSCGTGCEAQYNDTSLVTYADRFLRRDAATGIYNYDPTDDPTPFKRKITIDDGTPNKLEVEVEVFWGQQRVVASTELYNWLPLPPPARSDGRVNGEPSGAVLPDGTTSAVLSLDTNQNATCRYSTISGTRYTDMTDTFSTTGLTFHSTTVLGLSDGDSPTYYVRCAGEFYNTSVSDFEISFEVAIP